MSQASELDRGLVRIAGDAQERLERRPLLLFDRRPRPQAGLFEKAVGNLAWRAPADRLDPGDREQVLDQRLRAGVIGALQRRQHARLGERALARAAENGLEAQSAGDAAAQAPAPRLGNRQAIEDGVEQARVADPRFQHGPAGRRRRLQAKRKHLGVGRLGVTAAETLEPGLGLLAALGPAGAEDRAKI